MADLAASYIRSRVAVLAGRDTEKGSAKAATAKKAKKSKKSN